MRLVLLLPTHTQTHCVKNNKQERVKKKYLEQNDNKPRKHYVNACEYNCGVLNAPVDFRHDAISRSH